MIFSLIAAAAVATQSPSADVSILNDADHAIEAGRLEQARLMIARAISAGFSGAPIERLLANLAFASGDYEVALSGYMRVTQSPAKLRIDCERGAISALELGRLQNAKPLVDCAIAPANASWRAWNAKGVFADLMHDWTTADQAYARARLLAPKEARVANDEGWSKLLRGDWAAAVPFFEEAARLDQKSVRIANNLELARAAMAADLPQRRAGESDREWAARLNDAGVAAELMDQKARAVAAFTRALDVSDSWYERAANNLETIAGE
jgi:tetratricopeptide (TPR) repeat protein